MYDFQAAMSEQTGYTPPVWTGAATASHGAYGTAPTLPAPVSTLPAATTGAIAAGNQVNLQLPGYGASLSNIGGNIQSETAGTLPPDVIRQMQQQAAERGVATGTSGGPNNDATYLAAVLRSSLDLTNLGQTNLLRQLPALPGSQISQNPEFSPSSAAATDVNSSNAIYRSAPDPRAAAEAAMRAASAGISAGRGSVPSAPSGGGGPADDFFTRQTYTPDTVWSPGGNNEYINGILQKYDPSANNFDPLVGYQTSTWGQPEAAGGSTQFDYGAPASGAPSNYDANIAAGVDVSGDYWGGDYWGGE